MHDSQLSGTAKVVSKGGIMAADIPRSRLNCLHSLQLKCLFAWRVCCADVLMAIPAEPPRLLGNAAISGVSALVLARID